MGLELTKCRDFLAFFAKFRCILNFLQPNPVHLFNSQATCDTIWADST